MIDVFSLFGADNEQGDRIYVAVTIVVAIAYCIFLSRLPTPESQRGYSVTEQQS